jgi:hypothetical protein
LEVGVGVSFAPDAGVQTVLGPVLN